MWKFLQRHKKKLRNWESYWEQRWVRERHREALRTWGRHWEPRSVNENLREPLRIRENHWEWGRALGNNGNHWEPGRATENQGEPMRDTENQREPLRSNENQRRPVTGIKNRWEPLEAIETENHGETCRTRKSNCQWETKGTCGNSLLEVYKSFCKILHSFVVHKLGWSRKYIQ